jgi:hypothetical protein
LIMLLLLLVLVLLETLGLILHGYS